MTTVHRFLPHSSNNRMGRIALSIDGREARRMYRRFRLRMNAGDARAEVIHLFCKAVDE